MSSPAEKLAKAKPWRWDREHPKAKPAVWVCLAREARQALRLSMRDVAKAVGLSISGYYAIEMGGDPQMTSAHAIAEFFGKTIPELWPARAGKE